MLIKMTLVGSDLINWKCWKRNWALYKKSENLPCWLWKIKMAFSEKTYVKGHVAWTHWWPLGAGSSSQWQQENNSLSSVAAGRSILPTTSEILKTYFPLWASDDVTAQPMPDYSLFSLWLRTPDSRLTEIVR